MIRGSASKQVKNKQHTRASIPTTHRVVSRSAEQKQKVYYPRVSAEAEDVRYTIRGFGVLIKNDFEV